MTQFIEPNKKSDLTAPTVLTWLQSLRTGLLSGFTVSYNSGFNVDIASGKVVIRGTTIHDDLTRINQSGLASFNANAQHVSIWVSYTYVDTFPAAAMTIGATATNHATAPAIPVIPADSVKIADIFIPAGAASLATATIVNAPPLPSQGNADGDVLLERLIASNANIALTGGGGFTIAAGSPYTVTWTADISIAAPPITHREKFGTAPMVYATIAAGSLANVPANAILFTSVDRRTPNTPGTAVAATMQFIDVDAPTAGQMSAFAPSADRDRLIILGRVSGGALTMTNGFGVLPAPTTEPPPRFLGMDPGGTHSWESVDDVDLVGGLMSVADNTARDAIPGAQRKEGMLVYNQALDRHYVLEGGVTNGDWKEAFDDAYITGGLHVLTGVQTEADIPLTVQRVGMLVYLPATQTLVKITATGSPPTVDRVAFSGLTSSELITASAGLNVTDVATFNDEVRLVVIERPTALPAGNMSIAADANTNTLTLGRVGGTVSLPGTVTAAGVINADGGIGRSSNSGPLNIGVDADVTDINIGTASATGVINIGQAGDDINVVGRLVSAGVSSTGAGSASGVIGTGGPTNGTGGSFTAVGSGNGISATADTNGYAARLITGSSGRIDTIDGGLTREIAAVTTTNNSFTQIWSETLPSDLAHGMYTCSVVGYRTDSLSSVFSARFAFAARRVAGNAAIISGGANDYPTASPSSATIGVMFWRASADCDNYSIQATTSGADIVINVRGDTGHTVDWQIVVEALSTF